MERELGAVTGWHTHCRLYFVVMLTDATSNHQERGEAGPRIERQFDLAEAQPST